MGLQGERLETAQVTTEGVLGDRVYAVVDARSKKVLDPKSLTYSWGTSEDQPNMLNVRSWVEGDVRGPHRVGIEFGGRKSYSDQAGFARQLSSALDRDVELVRYPRIAEARVKSGRALHLLTDASIRAAARFHPSGEFDVRRFRPNLLLTTAEEGFVEEGWVGMRLKIGSVCVEVTKPNVRCRVTTMKQEGVAEDPEVLSTIEAWNGKKLGVMCAVGSEGAVSVGDPASAKKE